MQLVKNVHNIRCHWCSVVKLCKTLAARATMQRIGSTLGKALVLGKLDQIGQSWTVIWNKSFLWFNWSNEDFRHLGISCYFQESNDILPSKIIQSTSAIHILVPLPPCLRWAWHHRPGHGVESWQSASSPAWKVHPSAPRARRARSSLLLFNQNQWISGIYVGFQWNMQGCLRKAIDISFWSDLFKQSSTICRPSANSPSWTGKCSTWRFPEMGVPPNHPFSPDFPSKKPPALGVMSSWY